MSLKDLAKSKNVQWVGTTTMYFVQNNVYEITNVDYDERRNPIEITVLDETGGDYCVDEDELPLFKACTMAQRKTVTELPPPVRNANVHAPSTPSYEFSHPDIPFWVNILYIDADGRIYGAKNEDDEPIDIKLQSRLKIELPQREDPLKVLLDKYRKGEIGVDMFRELSKDL